MIKKIIKKTILYKPLKAILKKLRKIKKNRIAKKEEKRKLQEEQRRLKEEQRRLREEYLANLFTYEKAEKIINERFRKTHDYDIDFENPKTYTDKMNYSKLYNPTKIKTLLSDKITAREWVKKKIGEEYLVPILGIYDSFENIDFRKLPKEYVIKCNHDSGSTNIIDKEHKLNKKELTEKYHYYLNRNLAPYNYEMHYLGIEPKIIIEKNLGNNKITEIKFLCFNGKIACCWRDFDKHTSRCVYDADWNIIPVDILYPSNPNHDKPKHFEEMKRIAEKLAKGFDQVRVDLYEIDDKVYFNEMTFTSGNGMYTFTPEEYNLKLGQLWKLNTKKRKKLLHKELILEEKKDDEK